jgi:hypothetical protein
MGWRELMALCCAAAAVGAAVALVGMYLALMYGPDTLMPI